MERAEWLKRLKKFLETCSFKEDIVGVVACGSMVAGTDTPYSDLDLQIVLKDSVTYRERGNKMVDGLLIEYFANPPHQTHKYFERDMGNNKRTTVTMFASGEIIFDTDGSVAKLRELAKEFTKKPFPTTEVNPVFKYLLWDNLQNLDLQSPYGLYAYYVTVNRLYAGYVKFLGVDMGPLSKMERYFHEENWRAKNGMEQFPDKEFILLFENAARGADYEALKALVDNVQKKTGGFEIDGWTLRTPTED